MLFKDQVAFHGLGSHVARLSAAVSVRTVSLDRTGRLDCQLLLVEDLRWVKNEDKVPDNVILRGYIIWSLQNATRYVAERKPSCAAIRTLKNQSRVEATALVSCAELCGSGAFAQLLILIVRMFALTCAHVHPQTQTQDKLNSAEKLRLGLVSQSGSSNP